MDQIFATTGSTMYYGGIIGIGISIILLMLCTPIFATQRRKLLKKIEKDFNNKK